MFEFSPEKATKTLEELRASLETDKREVVRNQIGALQSAIDSHDQNQMIGALNTLEQRLREHIAIDEHRQKLEAAKLAVGHITDNLATRGEQAVRTIVKDNIVDPVAGLIPGGKEAVDATITTVADQYAKLPTYLKLPALGAVIGASSYLLSYPTKWLGWVVGLVSKDGKQSLESLAKVMQSSGKLAVMGGIGLGVASGIGQLQRNTGFADPLLEGMKSTGNAIGGAATSAGTAISSTVTGAPPPTPDPNAPAVVPRQNFDELTKGVDFEGYTVKLQTGFGGFFPTLTIDDIKWKINTRFPVRDAFLDENGLTVNVGIATGTLPKEILRANVQRMKDPTQTKFAIVEADGKTPMKFKGQEVELIKQS